MSASSLQAINQFDQRGLELDESVDYQQWIHIGSMLSRADAKLWWYIGDWWNFGARMWGEGEEHAIAAGLKYQACRNAGWVSRAFQLSRRRDKVGFSIHAEVAALPKSVQNQILDAPDVTQAKARKAARDWKASQGKDTEPLPIGRYSVIYADPPWQYRDQHTGDGFDAIVPDTHYPTMWTQAIADLPIRDMRAKDCVLFMWGTFPMLPDALTVIDGWGFEYKTAMVWHKMRPNLGHYHDASCELLMIATHGAYAPVWLDSRPPQLIQEKPERRHSAKPDSFYDLIDFMYPPDQVDDRIELFRRGERPRPHWQIWGNEADD